MYTNLYKNNNFSVKVVQTTLIKHNIFGQHSLQFKIKLVGFLIQLKLGIIANCQNFQTLQSLMVK